MRLKRPSVLLLLLPAVFGITVCLEKRLADEKAARAFGNMTYHVEQAPDQQNLTLRNGAYTAWELDVRYDGRYVYGDFNRDRLQDAAVLLVENTGGNQDWYTLAFLINDGERLVHQATIYLDDRAIIYSLQAKNGRVLVDMHVHQPDDCNGGPSKRLKEWYRYPGPQVFAYRVGTYIFGEVTDGIRGEAG